MTIHLPNTFNRYKDPIQDQFHPPKYYNNQQQVIYCALDK